MIDFNLDMVNWKDFESLCHSERKGVWRKNVRRKGVRHC